MSEIFEERIIKFAAQMRHTDREGLLHMILVRDNQIEELEWAARPTLELVDRITELEDDFDSMQEDRDYWKTQHDELEERLEAVKRILPNKDPNCNCGYCLIRAIVYSDKATIGEGDGR